ncbi:hypothetical protein, partial [Paenibacillus naphthalenovorans]|uniref:hypothetical protein n=1 Tax=Paenibacillus naphthalenovorans TaxID=162209 RepID=UPI003D27E277
ARRRRRDRGGLTTTLAIRIVLSGDQEGRVVVRLQKLGITTYLGGTTSVSLPQPAKVGRTPSGELWRPNPRLIGSGMS